MILRYVLVALTIFSGARTQAEDKFVETKAIALPDGFTAYQAQASKQSAHTVLSDGGMAFWLLDTQKGSFVRIAQNVIGEWDQHLKGAQWSAGGLVLFYNGKDLIKIVDPDDLNTLATFSVDLKSAPLRRFIWIDGLSILVDDTDFYRPSGTTLNKTEKSNPNAHMVQTGLLVQGNQYVITSGLHDRTLKIWSLPDGDLLHKWSVDGWFSKPEIADIALVNNRLLVGFRNGRLEERSLTGNKLWSARPCRDGVSFYYSSPFSRFSSVNADDGIFYGCGKSVGYIEAQSQSWRIVDVNAAIKDKVAEFSESESTAGKHRDVNTLSAVETVVETDLAVLVFSDGTSVVFNKKQNRLVQQLRSVSAGATPVSYVPSTKQLVLADALGQVHIYSLIDASDQ